MNENETLKYNIETGDKIGKMSQDDFDNNIKLIDDLAEIKGQELSECREKIDKIAIVGGRGDELVYTAPCGQCRQLIMEVASDCKIVCANRKDGKIEYQTYSPEELLPYGYVME